MLAEGKVGPPSAGLSDATVSNLRFNKHQALSIAVSAAKYYEYAIRGKLWYAKTADAGVAPGTSVGTTAAFSVHNSKGSGVNVILMHLGLGYVSGTLGAGFVSLCTNTNLSEAVPTGTAIVSRPALVGGSAPSGAVALTTSTLAVAPNSVFPLWTLGASLATTAALPIMLSYDLEGAIVIPPGGSVSLQGVAAAGTTPLVVFGACFAEEPA